MQLYARWHTIQNYTVVTKARTNFHDHRFLHCLNMFIEFVSCDLHAESQQESNGSYTLHIWSSLPALWTECFWSTNHRPKTCILMFSLRFYFSMLRLTFAWIYPAALPMSLHSFMQKATTQNQNCFRQLNQLLNLLHGRMGKLKKFPRKTFLLNPNNFFFLHEHMIH